MTKALAISVACAALALVAGCGSGGSSATTQTTAGAAATSPSSPAATTSKGAGASGGATKTGASGGLKIDTTPKYASPSSSSPVQGGVVQIAYRNVAIDPDTVRVKVGSMVRWTNYDPVEHNVTSKGGPVSFASRTFPEGQSFEVKLTKPGIVHYVCTIHPTTMNGTIEVVQ